MAKTIPQLTDATTVNAADELIIQQGGITKRATGAELAKGLNAINGTVNAVDFGFIAGGMSNTAAINAACVYAEANNVSLFFPASATIRVPSDFTTLQKAFDLLAPSSDVSITILIGAGHSIASGLVLAGGDFSKWTIASVDAEVNLSASFATEADIIKATDSKCPIINTVFNGGTTKGRNGFYLQGASAIRIESGKGVKNIGGTGTGSDISNVTGNGLALVGGAQAYARGSVFTGNSDINVTATQSSQFYGDFGTYNASAGEANVYIGRGSIGSVSYAQMNNCAAGQGLRVRRSLCTALAAEAKNNAGNGIVAEECAYVAANDQSTDPFEATSNGLAGVKSTAGSVVDFRGGDTTGSASGLIIELGSTIIATSATVSATGTAILVTDSNLVANSAAITGVTRGIDARKAELSLDSATIATTNNEGIFLQRNSSATAQSVTITGGTRGLRVSGASRINAGLASITGWSTEGISCSDGAFVNANGATVSQAGKTGCLVVVRGSSIVATGSTTTNGSPALGDTNVASLNAISANGVIFN
jgi:hypothetical protein